MSKKLFIMAICAISIFIFGCDQNSGGSDNGGGGHKNNAPIFITTAPTFAQIDTQYRYDMAAIDSDGKSKNLKLMINAEDTCGGLIAASKFDIGKAQYTFTPSAAQFGMQCVVGLTASDGKSKTDQNSTVSIGAEIAAPYFTSTASTTATEDILYTYDITAADDNAPPQPLTLTLGPIDTCGGTLTDNGDGTGTYTFTPSENEGGDICLLSLTVTDSSAVSVDQNSAVTIAEDNKAPYFTSTAPAAATEGIPYVYSATVADPDVPAQTLTCSKNGTDTCGGTLAGCVYSFTPSESQGGTTCMVGLNVSDGALNADQSETVTVAEDNKAPSFTTTAPATASEGVLYTYSAGVTDPDNPAQILTCSTNAFNTCGGAIAGCSYSFTPSEMQGGASCIVGLTVTDGALSADQNSLVAITEANTAPWFTSTASATATEGILYSYTATATDPDIPAQTLTCSKNGTDTCGGALAGCSYSFTPTETQGGANCVVGLRVSDGALTADQNTTVSVAETNQTPAWSAAPSNLSVVTGQTYNSINGSATDADLPAQTLTCSGLNSTCSFTINVSGSGTSPRNCSMSFTAGSNPETCGVNVQVSDGAGGTITQNVMISVQQCRIFVNDDATGDADGSSWANAFPAIQDAVDASWSSCEIWVAEGNYYKIAAGTDPVLTMKNDVGMFGGFLGYESSLAERLDPANFPTVLDGEDTSYHVVVGASNARLNGFYITGGKSNVMTPNEKGGGMLNIGVSNLIIANNNFYGNRACYGGGMYNSGVSNLTMVNNVFNENYGDFYEPGGNLIFSARGAAIYNDGASPIISNCEFSGNSARTGSAIYNDGASPIITNCSFLENKDYRSIGGGIFNTHSDPTITNCLFWGNVGDYGGGIYNSYSSPVITDCDFWGNTVTFGGGIDNEESSPIVTNCSFSGNAAVAGGGIYNSESFPTVINCTFSGNSAGNSDTHFGGGGIYNYHSSPIVTDCEFSENSAFEGGGIDNNGLSSPTITNCLFWGNSADSAGGIRNYYYSSPAISNCTFSGNTAAADGLIFNSDYSSPTITNSILWGNTAPQIKDITSSSPIVTYSDVQGGYAGIGNINANPLFVTGTYGDFYLSRLGLQASHSPCLNTGSDTSANLGFNTKTTSTNNDPDNLTIDMGYHYPVP